MSDEELIARLRGDMPTMRPNRDWGWREDIDLVAVEAERKEAADRIEQLAATNERLEAAVKGLMAVLNRNETKGPIPDIEMMFCWMAAQDVRAALKGSDHE